MLEGGITPAGMIETPDDAAAAKKVSGEETLEQKEIRAALDPVRRFAKQYPEMHEARFGAWVMRLSRNVQDSTMLESVTLFCEVSERDIFGESGGESFELEDASRVSLPSHVSATHVSLPSRRRYPDESEVEIARKAKALFKRFLGKPQPQTVVTALEIPTE